MSGPMADKISDAELAVVQAVWEEGGTATFAQIRERTSRSASWESPSTLNTLVKRLVGKGVLRQERRDVYYYSAALSREEFGRQRAKGFVDKVFGGSVRGLIAALVDADGMDQAEQQELREFWERQKGRDGL